MTNNEFEYPLIIMGQPFKYYNKIPIFESLENIDNENENESEFFFEKYLLFTENFNTIVVIYLQINQILDNYEKTIIKIEFNNKIIYEYDKLHPIEKL